jgi:hypothetical protein
VGILVQHITVSEGGKAYAAKSKYDQFAAAGKPAEGGGEATGRGVRLTF